MSEPQQPVTQLLNDWRAGNEQALNKLMPLVHDSLQRLAGKYMRGERAGHTLQATALVNEAFLQLVDAEVGWQSRAHFLAVAARIMRRILIDHARAKHRDKRGGDAVQVTLHDAQLVAGGQEPDVLDLENVLQRLHDIDARKADVVELSFFGGMTYDEIGEALGISAATVDRELRFAKAWLLRELKGEAAP
jgi:RNA polymerase sigma factor (TIGR02999 family)